MTNRRLRRALFWIWLLFLAAACQGSRPTTPSEPTAYASPTGRPTSLPLVQLTRVPTQVVQPSPTFTVASAAATVVRPEAAFTLTVLHTGQVYGETAPCGG